jgi:hypothetical protein
MNVNVGDKVYIVEDGEAIWGLVTAVDPTYIYIKWVDMLEPIKHHKRSLEGLFFSPDPESLEDKIKELLG